MTEEVRVMHDTIIAMILRVLGVLNDTAPTEIYTYALHLHL